MKKVYFIFGSLVLILLVATTILFFYERKSLVETPLLTQQQIEENNTYNQNLEKIKTDVRAEFESTIKSKLETWSLYEENPNPYFSDYQSDPSCPANTEWADYYQKTKAGAEYMLSLPYGLILFYTPNYEHWSLQQLSSSSTTDMGVCGVGGPIPMYAYPDKILWITGYCGGAGGTDCDQSYYLQQLIVQFLNSKTSVK